MKLFKSIIYLFVLSFPVVVFAQKNDRHVCGTDLYYSKYISENPSVLAEQENADYLSLIQNSPTDVTATVKVIPVVFHIIHTNGSENIPDAYIHDQIKRLNEDFQKKNSDTSSVRSQFRSLIADLGIEFRLARIDPQGKCTNGITRYYSTLTVNANDNVKSLPGQYWDSKKYLNVWVVSTINSSGSVGTILGYSYFPWMVNNNPAIDGVLIRADRIGYSERTLTHEIGHYLGLFHTFQDGCGNSDCTKVGDRICDTPPVADMNFGCDKTTNSCTTESPDQYDMIENFMDYADCTYLFTKGQSSRVQSMIQNYRSNIYSNTNLQATGVLDTNNLNCKVVAAFTAETYLVCAGSTVNFINTSFTSSAVQYLWEFSGGNPSVSFQKNESVTYNNPGRYDVKLVVRNSLGKDSIVKQDVVVIYPQQGIKTPFFESFESEQFAGDYWVIDAPVQNIGWYRTNKSASNESYSLFVNNFQNTQKDQNLSFTLPPISFDGITAPLLSFKHSFAAVSSVHTDKLKVYASDDCGVTWYPRYTKISTKLPTTSTFYTTEFIPNNENLWEYNLVDLSFFQNKSNVLIKFEFTTGLGNNIYIDDIKIGVVTSIKSEEDVKDGISIYPNPARQILNIRFAEADWNNCTILITDLLGNIIHSSQYKSANELIQLGLNEAGITKSGSYFLQIITKEKTITKIFTVTE